MNFAGYLYVLNVDTSTAAFQATPFYVARLIGARQFTAAPNVDGGSSAFFADALVNVTSPGPKGFTAQIFPIYAGSNVSVPSDITAAVQQWSVGWMGVES